MAMKAHALGCVSRPHHLVDLFEQVGSPAFRFCFDMSHFEVQGLSIEQAMYPLLALSAHAEVKASIGRAPNQEYMIPGELALSPTLPASSGRCASWVTAATSCPR